LSQGLSGRASVNGNHLSGHICGRIGREETDHGRHFICRSGAPGRRKLNQLVVVFEGLHLACFDDAWRHDVGEVCQPLGGEPAAVPRSGGDAPDQRVSPGCHKCLAAVALTVISRSIGVWWGDAGIFPTYGRIPAVDLPTSRIMIHIVGAMFGYFRHFSGTVFFT